MLEIPANLTQSTGYCLQFAYHMYGRSMGSLSVVYSSGIFGNNQTLWNRSSVNSSEWERATIRLPLMQSTRKVDNYNYPGRNTKLERHTMDVETTSKRWIDVVTTSFWRRVHAGIISNHKTVEANKHSYYIALQLLHSYNVFLYFLFYQFLVNVCGSAWQWL